jgi:hypothetical protein
LSQVSFESVYSVRQCVFEESDEFVSFTDGDVDSNFPGSFRSLTCDLPNLHGSNIALSWKWRLKPLVPHTSFRIRDFQYPVSHFSAAERPYCLLDFLAWDVDELC